MRISDWSSDVCSSDLARRGLEDRAEQLALSSRYKSELLANMSHELRTPLNSLLILANLLSDTVDGNPNPRQVEYCPTIKAAERRAGKEGGSTCRSRRVPYN